MELYKNFELIDWDQLLDNEVLAHWTFTDYKPIREQPVNRILDDAYHTLNQYTRNYDKINNTTHSKILTYVPPGDVQG